MRNSKIRGGKQEEKKKKKPNYLNKNKFTTFISCGVEQIKFYKKKHQKLKFLG